MTTHVQAKQIVDSLGLEPVQSLAVRLVGLHETHYGDGWSGAGVGSNNWGAVTAPATATNVFQHKDSRFDEATGKVVQYVTNFRRYATPADGARGLANVLLLDSRGQPRQNVAEALARRDLMGLATAMRENRYYLGVKPFHEAVLDYHRALTKAYNAIQAATGETLFDEVEGPLAAGPPEPEQPPELSSYWLPVGSSWALSKALPVLQRNASGELVAVVQQLLGIDADEDFGPTTELVVRAFQRDRGLRDDGVVGPKTWFCLFEFAAQAAAVRDTAKPTHPKG